jgi:hypothetical protein
MIDLRVFFECNTLHKYIFLPTMEEVWGTGYHSSEGYQVGFFFSKKNSRRLPNIVAELGKKLLKPCHSIGTSAHSLAPVKMALHWHFQPQRVYQHTWYPASSCNHLRINIHTHFLIIPECTYTITITQATDEDYSSIFHSSIVEKTLKYLLHIHSIHVLPKL